MSDSDREKSAEEIEAELKVQGEEHKKDSATRWQELEEKTKEIVGSDPLATPTIKAVKIIRNTSRDAKEKAKPKPSE